MIKRFIKTFRISHRMMILFQIMIIPLVILFALFLFTVNMLNETENDIMLNNVASIRAVYNVETSILRLRRLNANYIMRQDKHFLDDFDRNVGEFNRWYNEAFTKSLGKSGADILSNISIDFSKYLGQHDRIVELIRQGNKPQAINLILSEGNKYYNAIYENCELLIRTNDRIIDESESKVARYLLYSKISGYSTIVVFIIIGLMMLMIITRSITDPIHQIEKESGALAASGSVDELDRIKDHFHAMMKTLEDNQTKIIRTERRAAIGQIAAGISHELNNPIGIISGFAEMLLKNPRLTKKDNGIVLEIFRESQRCRVMLGNLLNFAKTPDPVLKMINPVHLLTQTIRTFQKHEKYRNIRFTVRSPKKEMKIHADRIQLEQVFSNLVVNAGEAMKYRGSIDIDIESTADGILFRFSDSGPGVKEEYAHKIFTPFFSTKKKGSGLGLALSHDIIDKHNGELYFIPSSGGAIFEIKLRKRIHGKRKV